MRPPPPCPAALLHLPPPTFSSSQAPCPHLVGRPPPWRSSFRGALLAAVNELFLPLPCAVSPPLRRASSLGSAGGRTTRVSPLPGRCAPLLLLSSGLLLPWAQQVEHAAVGGAGDATRGASSAGWSADRPVLRPARRMLRRHRLQRRGARSAARPPPSRSRGRAAAAPRERSAQ
jgi:hypothetical protein